MMTSGTAIVAAGDKVVETGKQIAAHVLEAAVADIEFRAGRFVIAGTDRSVGIMELAEKIRSGLKLPAELPQSLDVQLVADGPPSAFPNGCHIAEVEVDPETGMVEVVRYAFVNDFGTVINPLLVNGQAHGGIVQGIGQALREHTIYDEQGQLLTGSYMDYALPRAEDAPMFTHEFHPVPATTNVLGAKGCGEAGCAGGLPSVINALVDALSEYGVRHIDMPATPERVWRAIQRSHETLRRRYYGIRRFDLFHRLLDLTHRARHSDGGAGARCAVGGRALAHPGAAAHTGAGRRRIAEAVLRCDGPVCDAGAAAAVTKRLKLGTGVCLVIQRDTIQTAKLVASIDQVSKGRFLFGIGGGWNAEEIENHGTEFISRFKKMREQIEAMKEIWTKSTAEYHGDIVNFSPMMTWPKPVQKPHPPVILGGAFPWAARRAVRYGDGWYPNASSGNPQEYLPRFRQMAEEAGRDPKSLPVTLGGAPEDPDMLKRYRDLGVVRVNFPVPPAKADEVLPILDRVAKLKQQVGA